MKRSMLYALAGCGLALLLALTAFAQTSPQGTQARPARAPQERPSPPGTADFKFDDGKTITINYSRPKIRDPKTGEPRKIMGGVVPYGKEWRTGANEATSFVTTADLDIGGTKVPAGSYTLYTLPQDGPWKLIVSKKTGQWGIPYPGAENDLARIDMKTEKSASPVDPFTISFEKRGPNAGVLKLAWENTVASVDFTEANK
jgi:Protein of unknown function (DUF2911)